MSPLDVVEAKILQYVSNAKASLSCRAWKEHLYESLQLESRIQFKRQIAERDVIFSYNAVRPLAEDFEESVGYNFNFEADGTYRMQWTRTFDSWTSQSEQQVGRWSIAGNQILCETVDPEAVTDKEVRYAPAGWKYELAINEILEGEGKYVEAKVGTPAKTWELTARLGKTDDKCESPHRTWETITEVSATSAPFVAPRRPDARYVDIDGEMHEVSGDIVATRPEEQWAQLMRCRLRFGING